MQYPHIQFYRGSLVRLASGRLKQVEELSSDDFLESARLAAAGQDCHFESAAGFRRQVDENNNNNANSKDGSGSVFSSPEPQMELDDCEPNDSTNQSDSQSGHHLEFDTNFQTNSHQNGDQVHRLHNHLDHHHFRHHHNEDSDNSDVELDVVSTAPQDHCQPICSTSNAPITNNDSHKQQKQQQQQQHPQQKQQQQQTHHPYQHLYIDSSVVRDILEVGQPHSAISSHSPISHASSNSSPTNLTSPLDHQFSNRASSSSSPAGSSGSLSNLNLNNTTNPTVLIKFFLESSRTVAFIEVPTEHPFFVFHRGWSSWNPQRAYDKFGLKCRKLKIGDTCISLIRSSQNTMDNNKQQQLQHQTQQFHQPQQESDQCNIMFSSIKINE